MPNVVAPGSTRQAVVEQYKMSLLHRASKRLEILQQFWQVRLLINLINVHRATDLLWHIRITYTVTSSRDGTLAGSIVRIS